MGAFSPRVEYSEWSWGLSCTGDPVMEAVGVAPPAVCLSEASSSAKRQQHIMRKLSKSVSQASTSCMSPSLEGTWRFGTGPEGARRGGIAVLVCLGHEIGHGCLVLLVGIDGRVGDARTSQVLAASHVGGRGSGKIVSRGLLRLGRGARLVFVLHGTSVHRQVLAALARHAVAKRHFRPSCRLFVLLAHHFAAPTPTAAPFVVTLVYAPAAGASASGA
eukprot:scaffold112177_cov55-Attheya_sp.AAC.3